MMAEDLIARCREALGERGRSAFVSIARTDLAALIALAEPELQRIAEQPRARSAYLEELEKGGLEPGGDQKAAPNVAAELSPRAAHAIDASITPRSTW